MTELKVGQRWQWYKRVNDETYSHLIVEVVDPNQPSCRIVQIYKSTSYHVGSLARFKPTDATGDYCAACWTYLKGQDAPSKD